MMVAVDSPKCIHNYTVQSIDPFISMTINLQEKHNLVNLLDLDLLISSNMAFN